MTVLLMLVSADKLHSSWLSAVMPGIALYSGRTALNLIKLLFSELGREFRIFAIACLSFSVQ